MRLATTMKTTILISESTLERHKTMMGKNIRLLEWKTAKHLRRPSTAKPS